MSDSSEHYADVPVQHSTEDLRTEVVTLSVLERFATVHVPAIAKNVADSVVSSRDKARQIVEDSRANHRNFNRLLTLLFALLAGMCVTWSLQQGYWGVYSKTLAPYSFVITVLLDSSLAMYSLIKKY